MWTCVLISQSKAYLGIPLIFSYMSTNKEALLQSIQSLLKMQKICLSKYTLKLSISESFTHWCCCQLQFECHTSCLRQHQSLQKMGIFWEVIVFSQIVTLCYQQGVWRWIHVLACQRASHTLTLAITTCLSETIIFSRSVWKRILQNIFYCNLAATFKVFDLGCFYLTNAANLPWRCCEAGF